MTRGTTHDTETCVDLKISTNDGLWAMGLHSAARFMSLNSLIDLTMRLRHSHSSEAREAKDGPLSAADRQYTLHKYVTVVSKTAQRFS